MKQNAANIVSRANRLFNQLRAEKKKTALALGLITVMAIMWVRVLGRNTPASAKATLTAQQENLNDQANSQLKISFIELPKIPGRNDEITRDFFDSDGWRAFIKKAENLTGSGEVSVVSKDGSEEVLIKVAGKLRLEAIVLGESPQAFINGKLMSVGDRLPIRDGIDMYECKVVRIEENMVFIRYREVEITLRLVPAIEVTD